MYLQFICEDDAEKRKTGWEWGQGLQEWGGNGDKVSREGVWDGIINKSANKNFMM